MNNGNIGYFAPDLLEFEDLELSYAQFLYWCIEGDTNTFYIDYHWNNCQEEIESMSLDKGVAEKENSVSFEDMSEEKFFGWETSKWIKVAHNKELEYGCYNDDNCYAEFVHIKNGVCIRDYREYDDGIDTNEGDIPLFNSWTDVAEYVDREMM